MNPRHLLLLAPLLLAAVFGDDRIELTNGRVYTGKVIEETEKDVRFEIQGRGGRKSKKKFAKKKIHALVVDGKRRVLNEVPDRIKRKIEKAGGGTGGSNGGAKEAPAVRSREEVDKLIDKVGKAPPTWWQNAKLNYPNSLDLNWPDKPPGGWNNQRNVGQFIWDVINPNPGRWQEGVRLMSHIMQQKPGDKRLSIKSMRSMARMYHDLIEDWARAAFWWRVAAQQEGKTAGDLDLAHCYWKLGSKEMAAEILNAYGTWDGSRHMKIARLWGEMGEGDRAMQMALERARQTPDVGFLAAGDFARRSGKYTEAMDYYQKVIDAQGGGRDIKQSQDRARASLVAVKLFESLDISKVVSGTFKDQSIGYAGQVEVEVRVASGRIAQVRVTNHKEKQFYSAITDTTRQIVKKNSVKDIDATANATITSEAIINATAKALSQAVR